MELSIGDRFRNLSNTQEFVLVLIETRETYWTHAPMDQEINYWLENASTGKSFPISKDLLLTEYKKVGIDEQSVLSNEAGDVVR